jgi:DNA topoisomerase VI subunit B
MLLFDCVVKMGHQGAGRSLERHVRVRADNALEAMRRAKVLPGVKKGYLQANGASVLSVSLVR